MLEHQGLKKKQMKNLAQGCVDEEKSLVQAAQFKEFLPRAAFAKASPYKPNCALLDQNLNLLEWNLHLSRPCQSCSFRP